MTSKLLNKAHSLKRRQKTSSDDTDSSSKPPVNCYFTRGRREEEWHLWNTAPGTLTLHVGDLFRASIVASDFDGATSLLTRALADITIRGSEDAVCTLGRDMCFVDELESVDLQSAATQGDLVDMCTSKGIECASFLEHYTQTPQDEELHLGSQVCSLFVQTVNEMLSRRYEIMHHYPLFSRALGLYYSDKVSLEPPELKDMIDAGGLLDRSAAEHRSLHGIPLVGLDHSSFSKWNYPDKRHSERDGESQAREEHSANCDEDKRDDDRADSAGKREAPGEPSAGESRCSVSPRSRAERSEMFTVTTIQTFNNQPGTLTDRPGAFPYIFALHTSNDLTFDDLVNYCLTRTREPAGALPSRDKWGSVNPVLLMEDPVDPATGKTAHRYAVTSRGHLSTVLTNRGTKRCYNEVFLPGRPVSRLNLDVDLKCCQKCNDKFATRAAPSTKRNVSEALAASMILVIAESLFRIAKVKGDELESDPSLRELAKAVGKIAVYGRVSSAKSKLSLRMLWYLPVELCSFEGIETYRPLLDEMEKVSLNYALLSYPADVESCGLCDLGDAMRRGGRNSSGSEYLRFDRAENRRSSIDKAPYSFRKCVRLPNCYKKDSGFEYVDTFNTQDIEDPGFDDPLSLSVGLSSNPVLVDVTSLGSRFRGVLKAPGRSRPSAVSELEEETPDRDRVETEAGKLADLWGVPVTIRKTGSGLFCVQAKEKSTVYPCPIHNRVHSKSKLGALVFAKKIIPKCFVP